MSVKKDIVINAKGLFSSLGFWGVSMSQIAKECGKNKATLYHYYKSKEELYNAVVASFVKDTQFNIGKSTLPLLESKQQIKAYITSFVTQDIAITTMLNRLFLDSDANLDVSNIKELNEIQKSFDAIFKAGIGNGEFKMMNPSTVFIMLIGACFYYVSTKNFGHNVSKLSEEDFIDDLYVTILNIIKA